MSRWLSALRTAWLPCLIVVIAGYLPFRWNYHRLAQARTSGLAAWCYDLPFRFQPIAPRDRVLIVGISTRHWAELDRDHDGLVDRTNYVTLLRTLARRTHAPALVVVDKVLGGDSARSGEAAESVARELAEAFRLLSVERRCPVILTRSVTQPDLAFVDPVFSNGTLVACAEIDREPGSTARRLPVRFVGYPEERSVAWLAAQAVTGGSQEPPPRGAWLNYYGPASRGDPAAGGGPFRTADLAELVRSADAWRGVPDRGDLLVFLGKASDKELFVNPVDGERSMPGAEIHATAVMNLLDRNSLRLVPTGVQLAIIVAWGMVVAVWLDVHRTPGSRGAVVLAAVTVAALSVPIQLHGGWWWWWLIPVAIQTPVALAVTLHPGGFVFFISYRDSDGQREALWLEGAIRGAGHRAFLAPGNIAAGADLWPVLARRIRAARVVLLVLTPDALRDLMPQPGETTVPWVAREVAYALQQKRRILVLRVGTSPLDHRQLRPEVAALAERLSLEYSLANRDAVLQAARQALTGPAEA